MHCEKKISGPFAPVYFEGCYLLVFLMNTITSAHTKKNLPIPDVTLKNRGSEMIGKKSKNRPINRDRRSDLAALVKNDLRRI